MVSASTPRCIGFRWRGPIVWQWKAPTAWCWSPTASTDGAGRKLSRNMTWLTRPPTLDDLLYDPLASLIFQGVGVPFFRAILADDVYDALTYDLLEVTELPGEEIDGHACRRLRLDQGGTVWDVWVEASDAPRIRRASVDAKEGDERKRDDWLRVGVTYQMRHWEADPKLANDEFTFTPRDGWEKVDSLFPPEKVHDFAMGIGSLTSVGDAAPEATIEPIDGEAVKLADLRDRVVLVNFFATWCGPCLMELPDVQKAWNEFHGHDDFRLYVVGREETNETVTTFRKEHGFTFPMAADPEREVFAAFATQSIPRTYLIDRQGKIIYQCVGYDSSLRERKKLRALIKQQLGKQD